MAAPAANCNADAVSAGSKRSFPGAAAHSDRRVHPRHFHTGPNPALAAASSSGDDAAAAESDHPPAAARLYRHALESIFGFLNQRELATVLQVAHSWLAAVKSMASLRLTVKRLLVSLRVVADSVMGSHIIQLGEDEDFVPVTSDSLFIVARLMPQLRGLRCELQLLSTPGPLTFPPGLRELHLDIVGSPTSADVNATLEAISRLSLLETFFIHLDDINDQLSFAPLASLPQLRVLRINAPYELNVELSDAQVAQLRALSLLRRLDVWPMTTSLLRRLLAQPHQLQWKRITLPSPLDDEAAALLPQLPSLTTLGDVNAWVTCSNFDFLRQLPKLAQVGLYITEPSGASCIGSLVGGLQCCNQIESLTLHSKELTNAQLADLLPRLPRLLALSLSYPSITTLSFFAQPPMAQQLTSLQLSHCKRLPITEMRHVHALKGLKELRLLRSFNGPMDAHCQSLYTPPSLLLPQLTIFIYEQP